MADSGKASLTLATILSRKFFRLVCYAYPIMVSAQHRSIFGPSFRFYFPEATTSSKSSFCALGETYGMSHGFWKA